MRLRRDSLAASGCQDEVRGRPGIAGGLPKAGLLQGPALGTSQLLPTQSSLGVGAEWGPPKGHGLGVLQRQRRFRLQLEMRKYRKGA